MERLRTTAAARRLGVHAQTLRRWADEGLIPYIRLGDERRFAVSDLDAFLAGRTGDAADVRATAVYARVSGRGDQMTSLAAQELELSAGIEGELRVYRDVGSGLSEKRRGLNRMLGDVEKGLIREVRVTHPDRLARFGVAWLERVLAAHRCQLVVLHPAPSSGPEELLADFMALLASFAGRMYGQRSAAGRRRLLDAAGDHIDHEHPEGAGDGQEA